METQEPYGPSGLIGKLYEEKGGKTLFHVFAGDQRICTFEPGSSLAVSDGRGSSTHVGYYYHQDHLGSSSALSGRDGETLEGNVWYPFGRSQTATPQASFQVSSRFTGQILDAETGLYYYGARYYEPETRALHPAGHVDSGPEQSAELQPLRLHAHNPLKYTDPDGHAVETVWDAANLAMGVSSLVGNVKQGNIWGSIVDGVGIVADGIATAVPFVPAGAGTTIRIARGAQKVERAINNADAAKNTVEAAASGDTAGIVQSTGLGKSAGAASGKLHEAGRYQKMESMKGTQKHHVPGEKAEGELLAREPKKDVAVRLPESEHAAVEKARPSLVGAPKSARDLLAREGKVLRKESVTPNSELKRVIEQKKRDYPLDYDRVAKDLNRAPQ